MNYSRKMADGGSSQEDQLIQQIAQAIQQGADPNQLAQQLVQMGMDQNEAMGFIQAIMQQMGGGAQQQPMMGYGGGLPYAAMGMSFGTGDVMTMPNVENYPSYDTYKQAYNEYLSSIDTTTTINPDEIDYSIYADEKVYGDPEVDTFAQRLNSALIGPDDTLDVPVPTTITNPITDTSNPLNKLRIDSIIKKEVEDELNKAKGSGDDGAYSTIGKVVTGAAGLAGLYYGGKQAYKGGKNLYKAGQRRWGTTPEVNQSELTPEQIELNQRRVNSYKATIDERGYTVGKRDINNLVARGMSRADAEAYIKTLPTKEQYTGKNKKSNQQQTPQQTPQQQTQTSQQQTSSTGNQQESKIEDFDFSNVNDISEFHDTEYYKKMLEQTKNEKVTPQNSERIAEDLEYYTRKVNQTAKEHIQELIDIYTDRVAENSNDPEIMNDYQKKLNEEKAKLKRIEELEASANKPLTKKQIAQKSAEITKEGVKAGKTPKQIYQEKVDAGLITPGGGYKGVREYKPQLTGNIRTSKNKKKQEKIEREKERKKLTEKARLEGKLAFGGYVPEYAEQAYGAMNLPQFEMGSYYADGGTYTGTWSGNQGFAHGGMYHNPFEQPTGLRKFVYADGGMSPEEAMMMQQQGAPEQQGGGEEDAQMQQIVEAIVNMLEQGMQPDQIVQQLSQAGLPPDMAQQLVQHVVEQSQGGGQEQMMAQGQQQAPEQAPEQMMNEQGVPMQRYGGNIYANGGANECPPNEMKNPQGVCECVPGFQRDMETGICMKSNVGYIPQDDIPMGNSSMFMPFNNRSRGFNAGFGVNDKNYAFDYNFAADRDWRNNIRHSGSLSLPYLFGTGRNATGLNLSGDYTTNNLEKSWNANVTAGIPLTKKRNVQSKLNVTGGLGKTISKGNDYYNEYDSPYGMSPYSAKLPMNYNIGVEYLGKLLGEKGPNFTIKANYGNRQYGGMFEDGGEPCYDEQGNIIDCDKQKLQKNIETHGSAVYDRMAPFYKELFDAEHKYANPNTGEVSPLNNLRAIGKALIKHPEVIFMKKRKLPISEQLRDPYGVGSYTVDKYGPFSNKPQVWWPSKYSVPPTHPNIFKKVGNWWDENVGDWWRTRRDRREMRREDRFQRRSRENKGILDAIRCWGDNCYDENNLTQGAYGGQFNVGDEMEVTQQELDMLKKQGVKFKIIK